MSTDSAPRDNGALIGLGPRPPEAVVASTAGGGPYPLPRLGEVIRDAERLLQQAINVLGRQYEPTSAAEPSCGCFESEVDRGLCAAVADVRAAIFHLQDLAELTLPAAGSAVMFPARQVHR